MKKQTIKHLNRISYAARDVHHSTRPSRIIDKSAAPGFSRKERRRLAAIARVQ